MIAAKPKKPYPAYPLTAHTHTGRWCKRFKPPGAAKTKTYYFGSLDDWKAALEKYQREWPYIIEGKTPPRDDEDAYTIRTLCNLFLRSKRLKREARELSDRSYHDYYRSCAQLVDHYCPGATDRRVDDLRPADFEDLRAAMAQRLGPVSLGNEINRIKIILKFAIDQRLIDRPVHFGQSFARPSRKVLRRARNKQGAKTFSRDELRKILDATAGNAQLHAMILLGINGGLGNSDCANLHDSHVDLAAGWCDYPRPKTEVPRRIPLWPDTVAALKAVLCGKKRPKDPADDGIVFLTRAGQRWVRFRPSKKKPDQYTAIDSIAGEFGKVVRKLQINGRTARNFYTLRRQFEIIAGGSKDQVAVDQIMGHVDNSMAGVYRQDQIEDDRLVAVVEHVHSWLYGSHRND